MHLKVKYRSYKTCICLFLQKYALFASVSSFKSTLSLRVSTLHQKNALFASVSPFTFTLYLHLSLPSKVRSPCICLFLQKYALFASLLLQKYALFASVSSFKSTLSLHLSLPSKVRSLDVSLPYFILFFLLPYNSP
jgi:hypothetical protein